jgi:5'-nucleotidase
MTSKNISLKLATGLVASITLLVAGCTISSSPTPTVMTIAHINDHHSNLDPIAAFEFTVGGVKTQADVGGMARMSEAFLKYQGRSDVLKLHAGDAITGTSYFTFFSGEADAQMMNNICFDAVAMGNHEFDEGDAGLKKFLDFLATGTCKTFPLSANVKPKVGTALAAITTNDYIKPYRIKQVSGVQVGIVGITVKGKTQQSSKPLNTTVFEDEVTAAQRTIDELKQQGVTHIVLLTHQGYSADKAMASQLTDVDVIIGGDSHSLLGDFTALGVTGSEGSYPTITRNKDGDQVCIGQSFEYNKVIGEMNISFDGRGRVSDCKGQASFVIGTSFKQPSPAGSTTFAAVSDSTRSSILTQLSSIPAVRALDVNATASSVLSQFSSQVAAKKAEIISQSTQNLCLVRVPGESTNRSTGVAGCETANSLARGSDIAQVVAEAFLAGSLRADAAIQNAGGVRTPVKTGAISFNDALTVLPFSNVLVELTMTGTQIKSVLEDALDFQLSSTSNTGAHPYAAGLRWDLDMSQVKGSRITNLEVRNRTTGTYSLISPGSSYVVVTNDFIAAGKDGYTTFGAIYSSGAFVNTYLLYSQTFIDYLKSRSSIGRITRSDYSHKTVVTKAGITLDAQ